MELASSCGVGYIYARLKMQETCRWRNSLQRQKMQGYDVILADPPWKYNHTRTKSRKVENHYPTMTVAEICAVDVQSLVGEGAILFLWATCPKLPQAFQVMEAWDFEYKTCDIWDKKHIGMGYYYRNRHEILLVGSCGNAKCPPPSRRPHGGMYEARTKHSKKPICAYERIEFMYPEARKIELFARAPREGWDSWGNEIPSTIALT